MAPENPVQGTGDMDEYASQHEYLRSMAKMLHLTPMKGTLLR